ACGTRQHRAGAHRRARRRADGGNAHRQGWNGMSTSWSERLFGGLRRTSERLGENLSGLTGKGRLDDDDLDRIEEALITADLGPAMAARIRERLAARRDAVAGSTEELRKVVAEE